MKPWNAHLTQSTVKPLYVFLNHKLYGEILAVHGRVEEAAGQWRLFLGPDKTASVDAMSLQNRVWWHRHLGEEQIVAWMRRAIGHFITQKGVAYNDAR